MYPLNFDYKAFWLDHLGDRVVSTQGRNWVVRSPSRDDRHPSVSIDPEKGLYYDHATQEGLNPISFLVKQMGMEREEARAYVMARYSLGTTTYLRPAFGGIRAEKPRSEVTYPSSEFRFVEVVMDGFNRGKNSKIVEHPAGLEEAYLPAYGKSDCSMSVFVHSKALQDYHADPNTGNGTGSVAGYKGSVKIGALPFDFDSKADLSQARKDAVELVRRLIQDFHVVAENVRIFFSGCKGFHVLLMDKGFAAMPGAENIPARAQSASAHLAQGLLTFDSGIYKRMGLLRLPNTRNSKSGLFKIPLTREELEQSTISEIRRLAENQRHLPAALLSGKHPTETASNRFSSILEKFYSIDPDSKTVTFEDGVSYTQLETKLLHGLTDVDLRAIHLCKKVFGAVLKGTANGNQ